MTISIIGIDCATLAEKTGVAVGTWDGDLVTVKHVTCGQAKQSVSQMVFHLLPANGPVLLTIDAPLGWPALLGSSLAQHQAGSPLTAVANQLFRRETDRFIQETLAKTPLDVGADRIARTAHAALVMLDQLRRQTGQPIPLAWRPEDVSTLQAIEVYPAGFLSAIYDRGQVPAYKGKKGRDGRELIVNRLQHYLTLPADQTILTQNDNALDAVICVLCGADFLQGIAMPPINQKKAQKEGWIWVRKPGDIND